MTARKHSRPEALSAHLIVGTDTYLRKRRREEIIAATVPEEGQAFGVNEYQLDRTPLAKVLAQAGMRPMLSSRQVLVLSNLQGLDEKDIAYLEDYLSSPTDFTVLVFETDVLDGRTRLAHLLLKHCELFKAESPDDAGAVAAAQKFAREVSIQLDRDTAEELVFVLGNDQGRLRTELEKLQTYVGVGGQVTMTEVTALVSSAREFHVFDLADLLAERRRGEALALLRRLLNSGGSPYGIVGALAWLFRQLLRAQSFPHGTPASRVAQTLRVPRLRAERLLDEARKFRPKELREAFRALLEADVALKSSPANQEAVLETLIMQLTGRGVEARV